MAELTEHDHRRSARPSASATRAAARAVAEHASPRGELTAAPRRRPTCCGSVRAAPTAAQSSCCGPAVSTTDASGEQVFGGALYEPGEAATAPAQPLPPPSAAASPPPSPN